MVSLRRAAFLIGATAVATAAIRHVRRGTNARYTDEGILIGDTSSYDLWSRWLFGSFFGPIADDVAALAPPGGRVLDVGCGPGLLSIKLARRGLDVSGVDVDPEMVERARANAAHAADLDGDRPTFEAANAAALPFPDGSFDIVVSTLSVHHWADPAAGMTEIARVLRPTGRALIWDLRPGMVPFHRGAPDPAAQIHDAQLRLVAATAWRWPWRLALTQRIELVPVPSAIEHGEVKPRKSRRVRKHEASGAADETFRRL